MSLKGPFIILVITSILGLVSCRLFNPEPIPSVQESLPDKFSDFTTDAAPEQKWWETFNDSELNALIEEAFSNNLNLKQIWARLKQARAVAIQAGADRYPDLTGTAGATHFRQRTKNGSALTSRSENYSLGVSSNYELDLWGRVRAEQEAAILSTEACEQDLKAAAITLAAEVTNRWLQIIDCVMGRCYKTALFHYIPYPFSAFHSSEIDKHFTGQIFIPNLTNINKSRSQ